MKVAVQTQAQKVNVLRVLLGTGLLLLIPFVAMQFNTGVDWDETDFMVMGVLLFVVGLALETARAKIRDTNQLIVVALAILGIFFLVWAELAVGIFGTPFAGS